MVFPFSICFYCVSFYTIIILSVCVSWNVIKCINYHYLLLQNTRTNLQIAYFDVKKNKPSEPKGFLFCFGFISDQFKRGKKISFSSQKTESLHDATCLSLHPNQFFSRRYRHFLVHRRRSRQRKRQRQREQSEIEDEEEEEEERKEEKKKRFTAFRETLSVRSAPLLLLPSIITLPKKTFTYG